MTDPPIDLPEPPRHDPYAALRLPEYRRYLVGNVIAIMGLPMQTVAVGWEIYDRTHDTMALGLVGLVQFVPMVLFALPAGQLLDRFDRRRLIMLALAVMTCSSLSLAAISYLRGPIQLMYACLFVTGGARALYQPARASFLPQLVPRQLFSNAVTWNMSGFQMASVVGPALSGQLIGILHRAAPIYLLDALASVTFMLLLTRIASRGKPQGTAAASWRTVGAGVSYVWHNKVILAAMTLDMFAVLLGGAVALKPVFADILKVGPVGLGWMQTAPAAGAFCMAALIAHRPPFRRAGRMLLWSVAGFGLVTVVFGLSRNYWLSLSVLFLIGAFDNISVVVRHTLIQLQTPDEMRGRVSAVNSLFIGASNELGGFESGAVASAANWAAAGRAPPAFGPTFSVVFGGMGTIAVVAIAAMLWPQLRRYGRLGGEDDATDSSVNPP
jgi:MFS family permease